MARYYSDRLKYGVVSPGADTADSMSDITNHDVPSVWRENITPCYIVAGAVNDTI